MLAVLLSAQHGRLFTKACKWSHWRSRPITITACIDHCIVLQPAACRLLVNMLSAGTSCYADLDSLKMAIFGALAPGSARTSSVSSNAAEHQSDHTIH